MQLMDTLLDSHTTIPDMVDAFFSYKFNRYNNKIDVVVKKMRG